MRSHAPIGLFDSGLGGLSVVREVRLLLPGEDLMYVGDTAHVPYGNRPVSEVQRFSLGISRYLVSKGCRAIVVACNTATSAAVELLRGELPVPVVGTEPGVKPAAALTRTGKIGILATPGTLSGGRFATLVRRFAEGVEVITQPCPGWVERVEAGDFDSPQTRAMVAMAVRPLIDQGVDTLVLGCTHYSFLSPCIIEVAGTAVTLVDSGPAIARQVARVASGDAGRSTDVGMLWCGATGDAGRFAKGVFACLGEVTPVAQLGWDEEGIREVGTH